MPLSIMLYGPQQINTYHNTDYAIYSCSRKAIMSPLCNSGMSLSPQKTVKTTAHGMGKDKRAGFDRIEISAQVDDGHVSVQKFPT